MPRREGIGDGSQSQRIAILRRPDVKNGEGPWGEGIAGRFWEEETSMHRKSPVRNRERVSGLARPFFLETGRCVKHRIQLLLGLVRVGWRKCIPATLPA